MQRQICAVYITGRFFLPTLTIFLFKIKVQRWASLETTAYKSAILQYRCPEEKKRSQQFPFQRMLTQAHRTILAAMIRLVLDVALFSTAPFRQILRAHFIPRLSSRYSLPYMFFFNYCTTSIFLSLFHEIFSKLWYFYGGFSMQEKFLTETKNRNSFFILY